MASEGGASTDLRFEHGKVGKSILRLYGSDPKEGQGSILNFDNLG